MAMLIGFHVLSTYGSRMVLSLSHHKLIGISALFHTECPIEHTHPSRPRTAHERPVETPWPLCPRTACGSRGELMPSVYEDSCLPLPIGGHCGKTQPGSSHHNRSLVRGARILSAWPRPRSSPTMAASWSSCLVHARTPSAATQPGDEILDGCIVGTSELPGTVPGLGASCSPTRIRRRCVFYRDTQCCLVVREGVGGKKKTFLLGSGP